MNGVVVVVSADTEWRVMQEILPDVEQQASPMGQWFQHDLVVGGMNESVIFFHGGWGKIAAAASAQYVIDRWSPRLLVNIGTCGGLEGEIDKDAIVLVEKTIVYDIVELMGDSDEAIDHFSTEIDISWLGGDYPIEVQRGLLVSGDRDLVADEVQGLKERYGARAGDWESGAIAWVSARNSTRCLILRGVTDLVGSGGGEAYEGNIDIFVEGTRRVLRRLVDSLPDWIAKSRQ
jgi:adenosylhomocysteine nucleosidase